jgi:hypothetical protein
LGLELAKAVLARGDVGIPAASCADNGAKFQHLSEEVDRWERVSLSTDFTDQPQPAFSHA